MANIRELVQEIFDRPTNPSKLSDMRSKLREDPQAVEDLAVIFAQATRGARIPEATPEGIVSALQQLCIKV